VISRAPLSSVIAASVTGPLTTGASFTASMVIATVTGALVVVPSLAR
jgi:hypothetical protein